MRKLLTLAISVLATTMYLACSDDEPTTKTKIWDGTADLSWYEESVAASSTRGQLARRESATTFTISTPEQLAGLAIIVNDGIDDFSGKTLRMVNNFNLNKLQWIAIGTETNRFKGTFDGQGHTISKLRIYRPDANHQGLFGFADKAKFTNSKISDASVIGDNFVGTLVGRSDFGGTILNSSARNVSVEALSWSAGGLAGQVLREGNMENCFVDGAIVKSGVRGGGLLGCLANGSTLSNSYAVNVEVIGRGDNFGVIVGSIDVCKITNCYAIGKVNTQSNQVGGLGWNSVSSAIITNSFHSAEVNGKKSGLDLSEMKKQETFVGWDFSRIWQISPNRNNGFPTLR